MSKAKKVLGLVLAVAILFNVFVVATSAALASDEISFSAESKNALVAGGTVTVTFRLNVPSGVTQMGLFQYLISYDKDVLTPKSRTWNSYYDCFADAAAFTNGKASWLSSKWTTAETAIYDEACCVAAGTFVVGNTNGASGNAFNLCSTDNTLFSITFEVASTYDGVATTKVALLNSSFGNATRCYAKNATGTKYAQAKVVGDAVCTLSPVPVNNVAEKVRWTGGVKGSTMEIGLTATVTGVGALVAGPQTDITEIGFLYSTTSSDYDTITASGNKVTSTNLYNASDAGTYTFRAIVGNVDTASTTAINAVAYVVYKGVTYYAPDVTSVVPATVATRLPA